MRTSAFFFLLIPWGLFGQDPGASPPSGERPTETVPVPTEAQRQVHFSVFVWPEGGIMREDSSFSGIPRVFYDAPDGSSPMVPLHVNRSTPMLAYTGPQPLTLYDIEREWIPPPEDAPPVTPPTVRNRKVPRVIAEFPEGLDRGMLIVFPSRRQGRVLETVLLPYGTENVRPGMSRILNGTQQDLALKFSAEEGDPLILRQGRPFDFKPSDHSDDPYPRIFIYGLDEQRRLRLLHTNRIHFRKENTNFFIVIPEGVRRVRIKSLGSFDDPD